MTFKLALVTGASSGIGSALCRLLAEKGIPLILSGRDRERLQVLQEEVSKMTKVVAVVPADLADPRERKGLIEVIKDKVPDLVINNAGIGYYGDAIQYETDKQLAIVHVNVVAALEVALESARAMADKKVEGVVLNVSSAAGCLPYFPSFCVYAASKAFINSVSQGLNVEYASYGIAVLTACPGQVDTNFQERASCGLWKERGKAMIMSPDYAAQEIWRQIESRKPLYIFNGYYRFMISILLRFIPYRWTAKTIRKSVRERME